MSYISEKVAYLRGLMEGMGLDENENTTKLFEAVVDTLEDIATELGDITETQEELEEYIEEVDEALGDVEEFVYDDDCDCDCDCCCDDEDDGAIEVTCPACGEDIVVDIDAIDENGQVECPACGEVLEFEIDECDCGCDDCDD